MRIPKTVEEAYQIAYKEDDADVDPYEAALLARDLLSAAEASAPGGDFSRQESLFVMSSAIGHLANRLFERQGLEPGHAAVQRFDGLVHEMGRQPVRMALAA